MKEGIKKIQIPLGLKKGITIVMLAILAFPALAAEDVLIEFGSSMVYQDNQSDPGIGLDWIEETFDDSAWTTGIYGVGYGAGDLIQTTVPDSGTYSVYTRAKFTIADVGAVSNLFFGSDYCDGYVAWINGVEVSRDGVPAATEWDSGAASHESSNGPGPNYIPFNDISSVGIPALHNGENVLTVGVWNSSPSSSDLVVVPKLSMNYFPLLQERGPYLQMATPTSIKVRWRTTSPTDSKVSYGLTPGNLNLVVDKTAETTEHELDLANLSPDTKYYYSVGSSTEIFAGDDADHFFITPPTVGSTQPTRIWVLGDSGNASSNAMAVRDAYYAFTETTYTNLWLMLGDNAYPDGTDLEYQAAVFDMYPEMLRQSPLWATLGNHDGHAADSASQTGPYYDIFSLPTSGEAGGAHSGTEAYYSFDYGNIHFVCLDSYESDRDMDGAMYTWLETDLEVNSSDWLIAFWHHPPYSKGSHNSDTESRMIEMRQNFLPLLENYGVDLVLSGHSHGYERSYLLDGHHGSSDTLDPSMMIKDDGDGRPDGTGEYQKGTLGPGPNEGAVYVVSGASSKASSGSYDHPAMYLSFGIMGSVVIDIDSNILDLKYLDKDGMVQDYFTMIKGETNSVEVTIINPEAESVVSGSMVPIEIEANDLEDPDGTLVVEWNVDGGLWQATTDNNGLYEASWDTTAVGDGNHTINARATDSNGDTGHDSIQVTVDNINDQPLADFSFNCTDLTCNFDAANSSDPDGSIVSYSWDFGDGNTDNGQTASHTYSITDAYTVLLTVTDDDGATDMDTQSVQVGLETHVGNLSGSRNVDGPGGKWSATVVVTIHDKSENSLSGAIVTGSWSDGASGSGSCTTDAENQWCSITRSNINKNSSSVKFAVTDVTYAAYVYQPADNHNPGSDIVVLKDGPPANQPPQAAFTYSCTDLTCDFDASSSSDPDGTITSFNLDFGDGNTDSNPVASHTYDLAGIYTVNLTVSDNDNATNTDSQNVSVGLPSVDIHVGDLDGDSASAPRGKWNASVTVTIHDESDDLIEDATITGTWSGGTSGSGSCTTNADGQCDIIKNNIKKNSSSSTFTVTEVTHQTNIYQSAANHDPDGDSNGTAIIVSKP